MELKLKVPTENVSVAQSSEGVEMVLTKAELVAPAPFKQNEVIFKQKIPAYWNIIKGEKNLIIATSDLGDKFTGTRAEFNKLMRG